ncbi:MAG TPA: zinc-ribbon domain-containing protein [Ferruginibacter sp.]|nr:zinc-ribbon domain-containing protein [Ferruginibacter sp.]
MAYCTNCGTAITESGRFCSSCGTSIDAAPVQAPQQYQQTAMTQTATPVYPNHAQQQHYNQQPNYAQQQQYAQPRPYMNQQNVVVVGKQKSVGVAFLLTFFFGPLGLLYSSVVGGVVMFLVNIVMFLVFFPGLFLTWIVCIIWGCVAADSANKNAMNQASAMMNNQYRQ